MRILLFTDTLFDVNGVSRFIRTVAEQSLLRADPSRQLHVVTSTRLPPPDGLDADRPNIHNLPPLFARAMPGYPHLELALPPPRRLAALARRLRPDAVHVSTPGPVGLAGRRFALRHNLPLLGTYHTDFPAYIDHLFDDAALTLLCRGFMRRFYRPFARIFTRSAGYADALQRLGLPRDRTVRLLPGIDTDAFHPRHRPADTRAFWSGYRGVDPDAVKVLYVGRISVEKNLPMLARVWRALAPRLQRGRGPRAQLLVVGDGPYRASMQAELAGLPAAFLGFRHGSELSAIYAASDVFVFPSTTDTLGQVVMEAQSAGLPAVVTDRGGPAEVVNAADAPGRDRTGYILPAHDTDAWVRTLLTLVTTPALRAQLGAAAHRAIQPLSIRRSFDHFWSVHEHALASATHPPRSKPRTQREPRPQREPRAQARGEASPCPPA